MKNRRISLRKNMNLRILSKLKISNRQVRANFISRNINDDLINEISRISLVFNFLNTSCDEALCLLSVCKLDHSRSLDALISNQLLEGYIDELMLKTIEINALYDYCVICIALNGNLHLRANMILCEKSCDVLCLEGKGKALLQLLAGDGTGYETFTTKLLCLYGEISLLSCNCIHFEPLSAASAANAYTSSASPGQRPAKDVCIQELQNQGIQQYVCYVLPDFVSPRTAVPVLSSMCRGKAVAALLFTQRSYSNTLF